MITEEMIIVNDKERFVRKMHFEKTDRMPLYEWLGFATVTFYTWYGEGLPIGVNPYDYFTFDRRETIGTSLSGAVVTHPCIASDLNVEAIPPFVPKTIEETKRYKIVISPGGSREKILKTLTSVPLIIDYPIKTRDDFEKIKKRFDPENPRRYPLMWSDELIEYFKTLDCPLGIVAPSLFTWIRDLFGLTNVIISFYRKPDLINDMLDFRLDFTMRLIRPIVEKLGLQGVTIDFAQVDACGGTSSGPYLSPKLFNEFLAPRIEVLVDFLKKSEIDIIISGGHGNVASLIPSFLGLGINCLRTVERVASMDAVKLREEYGKGLMFISNFDVRALIKGEEAIKEEFSYQLPLAKEGGYIFGIDGVVPSNVTFKNYCYYANLLRSRAYE